MQSFEKNKPDKAFLGQIWEVFGKFNSFLGEQIRGTKRKRRKLANEKEELQGQGNKKIPAEMQGEKEALLV